MVWNLTFYTVRNKVTQQWASQQIYLKVKKTPEERASLERCITALLED